MGQNKYPLPMQVNPSWESSLELHGGIAIPFPEGKAVTEILEPWAIGPPVTLKPCCSGLYPPREGPAWSAVGCVLANEQLFRSYGSTAGEAVWGKLLKVGMQ